MFPQLNPMRYRFSIPKWKSVASSLCDRRLRIDSGGLLAVHRQWTQQARVIPFKTFPRRESMRKLLLALLVASSLAAVFASNKSATMPAPRIKVAATAPAYTLEDQNASKGALHQFRRKKNVALALYIF